MAPNLARLLIISVTFPFASVLAAEPDQRVEEPEQATTGWRILEPLGEPLARHEAGFIEFEDKFFLIGGRRLNAVSIYSPKLNQWANGSVPPVEFHHFQPVVVGRRILIIGAMTGRYPNETPLDKVLIYQPDGDRWSWGDEIPPARRRGAGGVVVRDGKVYWVGGIVRGHQGGYVSWFDCYDPEKGTWEQLPDAPHSRDHFQAALLGNKIYAAGGRRTSAETGRVFDDVVPEVDVFDFESGKWSTLSQNLPTPRAGSFSVTYDGRVIVMGGESGAQREAHAEVEAYDPNSERWRALPPLAQGRHGTGAIIHDSHCYTASGCANRGGSPELKSIEAIPLSELQLASEE